MLVNVLHKLMILAIGLCDSRCKMLTPNPMSHTIGSLPTPLNHLCSAPSIMVLSHTNNVPNTRANICVTNTAHTLVRHPTGTTTYNIQHRTVVEER